MTDTDRYTCAGCLYFCEGGSAALCCAQPGYPVEITPQRIACRHYLRDLPIGRLDDLASRLAVIEGVIDEVTAARRILTAPELADELAQLRARLDTLDRVVGHNGNAAQLLAVRVAALEGR